MSLVALLALPWMSSRMVDFTRESFSRPLVGEVQPLHRPTSPVAFEQQPGNGVRVAAAPAYRTLAMPVAPMLISTSSSSDTLGQPSMPSMQFRGSSMPQLVVPKSSKLPADQSPFGLPAFRSQSQQNAPQNIGG
jgi:hypothetical protein